MNRKVVKIDPRWWNTEMDVSIDVGLGTGSRDRDALALDRVLGNQIMISDRLSVAFPEKALEMLPYVRKTLVKQGEAVGIKNIDEFYPEVTPEDIEAGKEQLAEQAKQPPLELQIEEARGKTQAMLEQQKGQTSLQVEEGKNQLAAQQAELHAQGDVVKNQAELDADLQTSAADREKEITLEAMRQQIEREKIASNERIAEADRAQQRELELAKLSATEVEDSEPGPDGKPKKTGKKRIVDNSQAMMEQMAQIMSQLAASQNTNVEIVRGPDGRATGTRRVPVN
jgi:hypothetical protein